MENNKNVEEIMNDKKDNKIKGKLLRMGEIVAGSVNVSLESKDAWNTAMFAAGVTALYKWSIKSGGKAGAIVFGATVAINVIGNVSKNYKYINKDSYED